MISAASVLEIAIVAGSLAVGSGAAIVAVRARAASRADRLALRLVRAREATLSAAARSFGEAAAGSPDDARAAIAAAIRALAPAVDAVTVFEERAGALRCVAAFGPRVACFLGCRLALDDPLSLVVRALAHGHRVTRTSEPDAKPLHPADGFALAIPLALGGGRRCVVCAGAAGGVLQDAVEAIVEACGLATTAYRIALDRAEDRATAEYDGLTGLLTRRAFRERFAALVERARFDPHGRVALLFVDIDHFKTWNDSFGHASGDALLRAIAAQLRGAARDEGDLIGRTGGDEFCLAFPAMDKATAIERAAVLGGAIASADRSALRPPDATTRVAISASIGVAATPADAGDAGALLEAADAAMYAGKRSGRDTVSYRSVAGAFTQLARGAGYSSA